MAEKVWAEFALILYSQNVFLLRIWQRHRNSKQKMVLHRMLCEFITTERLASSAAENALDEPLPFFQDLLLSYCFLTS